MAKDVERSSQELTRGSPSPGEANEGQTRGKAAWEQGHAGGKLCLGCWGVDRAGLREAGPRLAETPDMHTACSPTLPAVKGADVSGDILCPLALGTRPSLCLSFTIYDEGP